MICLLKREKGECGAAARADIKENVVFMTGIDYVILAGHAIAKRGGVDMCT